jgi:hypothetical protein
MRRWRRFRRRILSIRSSAVRTIASIVSFSASIAAGRVLIALGYVRVSASSSLHAFRPTGNAVFAWAKD